jgi:hypothetical protein
VNATLRNIGISAIVRSAVSRARARIARFAAGLPRDDLAAAGLSLRFACAFFFVVVLFFAFAFAFALALAFVLRVVAMHYSYRIRPAFGTTPDFRAAPRAR